LNICIFKQFVQTILKPPIIGCKCIKCKCNQRRRRSSSALSLFYGYLRLLETFQHYCLQFKQLASIVVSLIRQLYFVCVSVTLIDCIFLHRHLQLCLIKTVCVFPFTYKCLWNLISRSEMMVVKKTFFINFALKWRDV